MDVQGKTRGYDPNEDGHDMKVNKNYVNVKTT